MDMKKTLFSLTNTLGGSGNEFAVTELVAELMKDASDSMETNDFGCLIARQNSKDPKAKTILFDAHIDQMAMLATGITDDGFVRFIAQGFDPRQLYGADVLIATRAHGLVEGVVNTVPVALNKMDKQKTVPVEKLTIDIGYPPEKVKEMVHIGDYIYYANETMELACGTVCGRAMDDRAGAAILIRMANELKGKELPVNVAYSFTPREETGGPGASLTGYTVKPDAAIAVDGSHAKCYAYAGAGSYSFSGGAIIGLGDHNHREVVEALTAVAKERELPYSVNLTPAFSKTNAGRLEYAGLGIPTAVVEFPMRYAHSSVEVADPENLSTISRLLAEFVLAGGVKE